MLAAADFPGPELKELFKTASVPALRWWLCCRSSVVLSTLCEVRMIAVLCAYHDKELCTLWNIYR